MDDPYSILGLYPDCSYEEAKAAYRRAVGDALMHHPDRHPPARKAEAERRFRILAHAFQHISKELGHPINSAGGKPSDSESPSANTKKPAVSHSSLAKPNPSGKPSAPGSVSQASKPLKSIERPSEPPKKLESHYHQHARSSKHLSTKTVLSDEAHRTSPPQDALDDLAQFTNNSSRPNSSLLEDDERDDYPSGHSLTQPPHPMNRRSSFSYPSERGSRNLPMVSDYDHSMGPKYDQRYKYPDREQLYNLPPPKRRDQDWDFGLGGDDFFGSSIDRFGATGAMMDGIGLGFDRMMSSAFQGLSMAGPGPEELARMESGSNCSMRMRQSKMVMGRTENGSWAGKKMEKHMNMANGRLEVSENAQDIRMDGGSSNTASRYPPHRNANMRRGPENWDPPPAYRGGEAHHCGEEGYEPYVRVGSAHMMGAGTTSPPGDVIPSHARHGSISRSSRSNLANMGGCYEQPSGLQRRSSSRFDYGTDPAHSYSPMGRNDMLSENQPLGRSLARRPSADISARY